MQTLDLLLTSNSMGAVKHPPLKKYLTFTDFICIFINGILQPKGVIFVSEHFLGYKKNENASMG